MEIEDNVIDKSLPALPDADDLRGNGYSFIDQFFSYLGTDICHLPKWWSRERDIAMRKLTYDNDFIGGIIYTLQVMLYNLKYQVVPVDTSINNHNKFAQLYDKFLGYWLHSELEQFIMDVLTTDNGGFMYLDHPTPSNKPLDGAMPTGLRTLDSTLCTRTRNTTYPVVYSDPNTGKDIAIHYSRIIFLSQFPSNDWAMNRVGNCSVGRIHKLTTHLDDIIIYDLEQLGSLQSNRIVVGTGTDAKSLSEPFKAAEGQAFNSGLTRSGKTVFIGLRDSNGDVKIIELKNGVQGKDKRDDIEITISLIALVLGVQAYLLLESTQSSSTRSSARESIKLSENKLFSWFWNKFSEELNFKLLPTFLKISRPGEDRDIDGTQSRIRVNNSTARKNDLSIGLTSPRVEREQMVSNGELTYNQFVHLELEDGRLPNGLNINTIFYGNNVPELLQFGFDPIQNSQQLDIVELYNRLSTVTDELEECFDDHDCQTLLITIYALQWLINKIENNDNDFVEIDAPTDVVEEPVPDAFAEVVTTERDLENENWYLDN